MQRRPLIFGLFAVAYFLSYFFRSANAVIAGDLRRDLGLTPEQLGLMTSLHQQQPQPGDQREADRQGLEELLVDQPDDQPA
jgi:hypothetical protein